MKAVIDADQLVYSVGFATEGDPISHSYQLMKTKLNKILKRCDTEDYQIFIGGEGNFREDIAISATYKGTRTGKKPSTYNELRTYLIEVWGAQVVDGYEADDAVSIKLWQDYQAHSGDREFCQVICVSPDKDLNNTPGWHYNPNKDIMRWVTPHQADRHFWFQMLAGDKVDNIPGLPYCTPSVIEEFGLTKAARRGCGEGSARKIMESDDYVEAVLRCYSSWALETGMEAYLHEYLLEQANLLHMGREIGMFGEIVPYEIDPELVASAMAKQLELEFEDDNSTESESSGEPSSPMDDVQYVPGEGDDGVGCKSLDGEDS